MTQQHDQLCGCQWHITALAVGGMQAESWRVEHRSVTMSEPGMAMTSRTDSTYCAAHQAMCAVLMAKHIVESRTHCCLLAFAACCWCMSFTSDSACSQAQELHSQQATQRRLRTDSCGAARPGRTTGTNSTNTSRASRHVQKAVKAQCRQYWQRPGWVAAMLQLCKRAAQHVQHRAGGNCTVPCIHGGAVAVKHAHGCLTHDEQHLVCRCKVNGACGAMRPRCRTCVCKRTHGGRARHPPHRAC